MDISASTKMAVVMLVKADTQANPEVRKGVLALFGDGPCAVPQKEADAFLRTMGQYGAVLSPADAAARLGVSRRTLYRWEKEGCITLSRVKLGLRRVGLHAAEIEAVARRMAELRTMDKEAARRREDHGTGG